MNQRLISPFVGNNLTDPQKDFNYAMSAQRIAVENVFARIQALWGYIDYHKN